MNDSETKKMVDNIKYTFYSVHRKKYVYFINNFKMIMLLQSQCYITLNQMYC